MNSNDFLKEGIGEDAHAMALDHEVQMARQECYHAAENAIALHKLLRHMSEQQGLEGWVSAKITLAADYLETVRKHLEYQLMSGAEQQAPISVVTVAENVITQEDLAPVTEANPYHFDSDEDYYAAQNARAKPRYRGQQSPGVNPDDEDYFREIWRKKREAAKKAEQDKDQGVAEASFDYTMKDLGNDYAGFPSQHSLKHKMLVKIKPEKQQLYKDKMNNTRDWDSLFALFKVAKERGDIIEPGDSQPTMGLNASLEQHADDKMKELGHKFKPVTEMDGDSSGRDGSNRKRMSSYGTRDRDDVSNGPDIHLGAEHAMKRKDITKRAGDVLNKEFDKSHKDVAEDEAGTKGFRVTWSEAGSDKHTSGLLLKHHAIEHAKMLKKKPGTSNVKVIPYRSVEEDEAKLKAYKRASAGDAINRQNIARHTGKADPKIAKRNAGQERAEKRLSSISQGISETSAGSVAGVVAPVGKNKAKVGSLFGGTYKQKKVAK